jgi:hypothetical protein
MGKYTNKIIDIVVLVFIICIKNQQNSLNSTDVYLLWYFHLHVLADNPAIFRVTFLLQEYSVTKCVKLQHNIEIPVIQYDSVIGVLSTVSSGLYVRDISTRVLRQDLRLSAK